MPLTPNHLAHFNTFGFLHLPGLFVEDIEEITAASETLWDPVKMPIENEEIRVTHFFEQIPRLTDLIVDDRFYPIISQLLGDDVIWVGSEGNVSGRRQVNWHPDRKYYREGEEHRIDFRQIKVMIYLDSVGRETGCLRVVPGSHRMPLHKELAQQEVDPATEPFGVDGSELPCAALESTPGDVILFNHCIWHAAYGGGLRRRYIAMKFAARPSVDDQLVSLEQYTPRVFDPHETFLKHDDVRIRSMVEPLPAYREGHLV